MTLAELEQLSHDLTTRVDDPPLLFAGDERAVAQVTEDSRRVRPGAVFFAFPGEHHDGHAYAEAAVQAGANAIVGDRSGLNTLAGVPYLHAAEPRALLGVVAHRLLADPSSSMTVIGVTGTNGKSSIVTLLRQILGQCDRPTAAFGTLGYVLNGERITAPHTTPFAEDLAELFRKARDTGHTHVAMEVSSHALDQHRVAGIDFDVAVFTNLTQDHLDYHQTMDEYREAKLRLFKGLRGETAFGVVNREDPSADFFIDATAVRCYTYGVGGDCRAEGVRTRFDGTEFNAVTPWGQAPVRMKLVGLHNVSNVLAAITVCGGLGLPLEAVAQGIESLSAVPGRFERVDAGQPFHVIVDYAHTEDGLRNVLRAAREICSGRLIVVFGCGGDRDRTKRPRMAAAVAELGDFAVLTSDNPRTEDPHRILIDVEAGMEGTGKVRDEDYLVIENRKDAIAEAIGRAQPGDLVMIAGKGHEDYQILGTERVPFDDRAVAREILENLQP